MLILMEANEIIVRASIASTTRNKMKPKIIQMSVKVNQDNYNKVYRKLEFEYQFMVKLLRWYYEQGLIKSVIKPKNKKMRETLRKIVDAKRSIRDSRKLILSAFN